MNTNDKHNNKDVTLPHRKVNVWGKKFQQISLQVFKRWFLDRMNVLCVTITGLQMGRGWCLE